MAYINKKGLVDDGKTGLTVAGSVAVSGDMTVVGTTTTSSPISASAGLSGSLQQVGPGLSYLVAGTGMTVSSASNGQVTLGVNNSVVATVSGTTFSGPVTSSLGMQSNHDLTIMPITATPSISQFLNFRAVALGTTHQWVLSEETLAARSYVAFARTAPTVSASYYPLWVEGAGSASGSWGFSTSCNIVDLSDKVYVKFDGSSVVKIGFFGSAAVAKPTVTGSIGGNTALEGLLNALVQLGLITSTAS